MEQDKIKDLLGRYATQFIKDGTIVGLGSGSTAQCFIKHLAPYCKEHNIKIAVTASSVTSARMAKELGFTVLDYAAVDIVVDGADEVDPQKRLIKGAGGAHVREKILAYAAKELLIIVDETKLVDSLGQKKLPVEILSFGHKWTIDKIRTHQKRGELRLKEGKPFVSDNGNLIWDIIFEKPPEDIEELHNSLSAIPGVLDTGFFKTANRVLIGTATGTVQVME